VPDLHRPLAYRPDIDGLRAVAVLAVVVYHAYPHLLRGGFTGVDVFFVISGYLISSLIWNGLDDGDFSLLVFYGRRVVRLFPALVVVLAACLAAGWWLLIPTAYERLGRDVAAAAAYVSNVVFWRESGYFDPAAATRPLTHLWSLAVEEQFYLLYPWALMATARRPRACASLLVGLLLTSFVVNIITLTIDPVQAFYLLPARLWELVAGGLLAYAHRANRNVSNRATANVVCVAGVALLPLSFLGPKGGGDFPGWWALVPVGAALAIVGAGQGAIFNRVVLASAPAVLVGRISYPLYLWHFPLLSFARARYGVVGGWRAAGIVATSLVLAYVTYRFVEMPVRARVRKVSWAPVPVLVALLVAVGAGGAVADVKAGAPGRIPFAVQRLIGLTDRYDYRTLYREGTCFLRADQNPSAFTAACAEHSRAPLLFVWGDSRAAHLYPGLRALESRRHFRIAQFTASSCPPYLDYVSTDRPLCHEVNRAVTQRLRALRPRTVILAAAWDQYTDNRPVLSTIAFIRSLGIDHIVIVGPGPRWPQGMPQALYDAYQDHHTLPTRLTNGLSGDPPRVDRQMRALARLAHVRYVSPLATLCSASGCLARVGPAFDQIVIWDSAHFTRAGSEYFVRKNADGLLSGITG
jgi:peptidoglycan/LPS O-acetylase OafA/YrhL